MRLIEILDTTLRDGEQAPGAVLGQAEKLRFAHALAELGVDTIEAGFPAASEAELAAVQAVARDVRESTVAALARATDGDVDAAARALAPAKRSRIHVFISTSEIHLERMLRITPGECIDRAVRAVRRASEHADEVEFSAQDATRTDSHFLVTICQAAARAGARYINIPDTVGYAQPAEFAKLVLAVRGALATYNGGLKVSVHCHNDLGLAVANTLAAVEAGAQQVEVCVNGMGERGANAFAHASGIHQDGVLKDPLNYEIMTPDSVGWDSRRIVVTRLSGRHGLAARFQELGIALDRETLDRAYGLAMDHSAVAPELDDRMLIAIAAQARRGEAAPTAAD